MYTFLLLSCLLLHNPEPVKLQAPLTVSIVSASPAAAFSILFPKNNQKVRGEYKIYGKAKPGTVVKLLVSSKYYKTTRDNRGKISKGEGPVNRMNRKFSLTADRSGNWVLKNIELLNAGWEESFSITATAEGKTTTIMVYDNTRPVNID